MTIFTFCFDRCFNYFFRNAAPTNHSFLAIGSSNDSWHERYPCTTSKGIASLQENDYSVVVRNAGGLGVIADSGILNVSLILPNNSEHKLSIDAAYELMWAWLRQSFPEKEIDAFEITTSYCPGTYDLSIGGQSLQGLPNDASKTVFLS